MVFLGFLVFPGFCCILGNVGKKIHESTSFLLQIDEKSIEIQTREQPMLARLARAQLANIG